MRGLAEACFVGIASPQHTHVMPLLALVAPATSLWRTLKAPVAAMRRKSLSVCTISSFMVQKGAYHSMNAHFAKLSGERNLVLAAHFAQKERH